MVPCLDETDEIILMVNDKDCDKSKEEGAVIYRAMDGQWKWSRTFWDNEGFYRNHYGNCD